MEAYEYATAKSEIESFFWQELADNYLEMCKQRLYDETHPNREGRVFAYITRYLRWSSFSLHFYRISQRKCT